MQRIEVAVRREIPFPLVSGQSGRGISCAGAWRDRRTPLPARLHYHNPNYHNPSSVSWLPVMASERRERGHLLLRAFRREEGDSFVAVLLGMTCACIKHNSGYHNGATGVGVRWVNTGGAELRTQ